MNGVRIFGKQGLWNVSVLDGRVASLEPSGGPDSGKTLVPRFVDPHAHILPMGLDLVRPSLAGCATRDEALDRLNDAVRAVAPGDWLMAVGYDHNKFPDGRHLTVDDLDSVSNTVPIDVRHISGHCGVVNSVVLRLAEIDSDTPDPTGGTIVKDASGRPTGLLLERAHELLRKVAPDEDVETMSEAIVAAGHRMYDLGLGTVADMMTGYYDLGSELQAYVLASRKGCPIRLRLYVQWSCLFGPRADGDALSVLADADPARCRVAGVKVFVDGALGAKTAAIRGAFEGEAPNPKGWSGTLVYRPERVRDMVRTADQAGFSVAIHAIGDHGLDVAMDALEMCDDPSRHRIEHAMMADDAQIDRLARLQCWVCLQPEFLTDFADAYQRSIGPSLLSRLNRLASMERAGVRICLGTDRPITVGDPWQVLQAACHRPDGFDPSENLSEAAAFDGLTRRAALALGDKDLGGLEPGDWADFLEQTHS